MLLKVIISIVFLETVLCGFVSVELPFQNPAGITYSNKPPPEGLQAGPDKRWSSKSAQYSVPVISSPSIYAYSFGGQQPPVQYHLTDQNVRTVQQQPVHTTFSVVQPTVASVAQPAFRTYFQSTVTPVYQETVPVQEPEELKPIFKTKKYQVRRPAIKNEFYDIEERVIIRPVGSALVELEHPISKTETKSEKTFDFRAQSTYTNEIQPTDIRGKLSAEQTKAQISIPVPQSNNQFSYKYEFPAQPKYMSYTPEPTPQSPAFTRANSNLEARPQIIEQAPAPTPQPPAFTRANFNLEARPQIIEQAPAPKGPPRLRGNFNYEAPQFRLQATIPSRQVSLQQEFAQTEAPRVTVQENYVYEQNQNQEVQQSPVYAQPQPQFVQSQRNQITVTERPQFIQSQINEVTVTERPQVYFPPRENQANFFPARAQLSEAANPSGQIPQQQQFLQTEAPRVKVQENYVYDQNQNQEVQQNPVYAQPQPQFVQSQRNQITVTERPQFVQSPRNQITVTERPQVFFPPRENQGNFFPARAQFSEANVTPAPIAQQQFEAPRDQFAQFPSRVQVTPAPYVQEQYVQTPRNQVFVTTERPFHPGRLVFRNNQIRTQEEYQQPQQQYDQQFYEPVEQQQSEFSGRIQQQQYEQQQEPQQQYEQQQPDYEQLKRQQQFEQRQQQPLQVLEQQQQEYEQQEEADEQPEIEITVTERPRKRLRQKSQKLRTHHEATATVTPAPDQFSPTPETKITVTTAMPEPITVTERAQIQEEKVEEKQEERKPNLVQFIPNRVVYRQKEVPLMALPRTRIIYEDEAHQAYKAYHQAPVQKQAPEEQSQRQVIFTEDVHPESQEIHIQSHQEKPQDVVYIVRRRPIDGGQGYQKILEPYQGTLFLHQRNEVRDDTASVTFVQKTHEKYIVNPQVEVHSNGEQNQNYIVQSTPHNTFVLQPTAVPVTTVSYEPFVVSTSPQNQEFVAVTTPIPTTPTTPTPIPTTTTTTTTTPAPETTTEEFKYDYDDSVVIEARGNFDSNKTLDITVKPIEKTSSEENKVEEPPVRGDIAITYSTTTSNPLESEEPKSAQLIDASSRSSQISNPVIIKSHLSAEEAKSNQDKYIELLSAHDGITEIGMGKDAERSSSIIDSFVRSRVLSATPAPKNAKETARTVNIRRIVVSSPIETVQEVEVSEYQGHGTERTRSLQDDEERPPIYIKQLPPAFSDSAK